MSERKSKPKSRIWFLDSDELLGNPAVGKRDEEREDEVDKALKEAARRKVQKLKSLELDKYLIEVEKEVKKLKEGEKGEKKVKEEVKSQVTPAVAMQLSQLPEEQRRLVVETYTMLKGAEKGEGALGYMLPMLIGYARTNPQAGQSDMVKFAEVTTKQIQTGIDLAKSTQTPPAQASFNPVELIRVFAEVMRDNVQKPLQEAVEKIQPQPSALEQILLDDKLFERAKSLGMFGGGQPQATSPEIMLEIEKLRTERDTKLEEMRHTHDRWLIEQRLEEKKWEHIGKIVEGPIGRTIETFGKAGADRVRGLGQASSQQEIPNVKVEQISCPKCTKPFFLNALGDYAVCPYCGSVLSKASAGGKQPSGESQQGEGETESKSTQ